MNFAHFSLFIAYLVILFICRVRSVLIPAHLEHMGRVVKRNVIAIMEPPVIILMGDVTVRQDIPDLWCVKS